MVKLFESKNKVYTPLLKPLTRRYDFTTEAAEQRKKDQKNPKSPRYKKNMVDKLVDRVIGPY